MRAVGRIRPALIAGMAVAFAGPTVPLLAQSRLWRPDERVLLSDFSWVTAVAASPWRVYAATRHGLLIYDRGAQAWRPPVTVLDGYPEAPALVALADVTGNAVWLGLSDGWARYDEDMGRWERGYLPGGVGSLMLDNQDLAGGVYIRGASGWAHLSRGAIMPDPGPARLPPGDRRVMALDPETALQQSPSASAFRSLMLTDAKLRAHRFLAAEQGGVWVGGSVGLAFWNIGRSTFRSLRVPGDLPATIRDLAALPPYVWVATDSGLVRLRRDAVRP